MSKANLSLTNDHIFHRVFAEEETKDSLIYIINEVFADLNLQKIKEITILNPITYSEFIKGKNSVLDIKAKSETDELFNIEMQIADEKDFIKRSHKYLSQMHATQGEKGGKYTELKPAHSINFIGFSIVPELKDYHRYFLMTDCTTEGVTLNEFHLHYIEMNKVKKIHDKSTKLEKMIYFMKKIDRTEDKIVASLIKNDANIKRMYEDYKRVMSDTDMVHYFQSLEKKEADELNRLYNAEDKGLAKGKAEGEAQKQRKMVKSMHAEGLDIATIARIAKLSEAEVQQIIDNPAE